MTENNQQITKTEPTKQQRPLLEGNEPIGLFLGYSAVTECDNSTFSLPTQPLEDGRFSILSCSFSLRSFLELPLSTGGWKRNQVAFDLQQGFIVSVSICSRDAHGTLQILSPLTCKGCASKPQRAAFMSAKELFSIPLPHFLRFCQVPSWDCQHYCNLWSCTAISLKQFPCTFIQLRHKQEVPRWRVLALL